jgi:SAM-dependent methyltransferase
MRVEQCRVCHSPQLAPFLDLGETALANRFLDPSQGDQPEPRYPLRVVLCLDCGLVQIDEEVPREILFGDYIYVSGTSDLVRRHAQRLARTLCRVHRLGPRDLVLEAASNDGTVLKAFRQRGVRVLGVEPAANVAELARREGVPTETDFFDVRLARDLRAQYGAARLVLARHVLAHVADLHGFVAGITAALAEDGVAVIETPWLGALCANLEFDTIYHEHLCYYSLRVLDRLFARSGLRLLDAELIPLHGGSLLVQAGRADGPHWPVPRLALLLQREEELRLSALATWQGFAARVARLREELLAFLDGLRARGCRLAGYGAPAKGNTLLEYCGIGPERLPYLVDKSPYKQGRLTPGRHIPVCPPERLLADQPDVTLILAWNFAAEVLEQQAEYQRRGGRFAVPVPAPRLLAPPAPAGRVRVSA